jgi:hypothetical protein
MRRAPALLLVVLLSACERAPGPGPCPGEPQARLELRATLVEGSLCATAAGVADSLTLPVTIAFTGPEEAAVCPDRALAEPLVGSRSGDAIEVAAVARSASLRGCACSLQVLERVSGTVLRDGSGVAAGFSGELVDSLVPAGPLPTCAASPGETCPAPCRVRWALAAP